MNDLRDLLDRAIGPIDPPTHRALDLTVHRAQRRQRRRRVGGTIVGLAASLIALTLVVWVLTGRQSDRPAAGAEGIFTFVGGDNLTGRYRLYTMDADGSALTVIPTGDTIPFAASPSPDGERIVMMASEPWQNGAMPNLQLFLMNTDGSQLEEIAVCPDDGCQGTITVSWSPDGRTLLFPGKGNGIWALDLETRQSRRLSGGDLDTNPVFSPEGDRIAFERTEPALDPSAQIWLMNADGTGTRPLTDEESVHEASQPAWSPDGSTVAYVEGGEPGGTAGLVVIGADGSSTRQLTTCVFGSCDRFPSFPVWSQDGGTIAVLLQHPRLASTDLALVDTTSGDLRVVREFPFSASSLSWQTASGS
jgi:Tol biopolymer transport system component